MKKLKPLLMASLTVLTSGPAVAQPTTARPPQYIMMSFDGSYTLGMWQATREHGQQNKANYTHFISGVDFLVGSSSKKISGSKAHIYTPPRYNGKSRSTIGFGGTREMVADRLREVIRSSVSGMEIAGHANGHFDGTKWSRNEWIYEFDLYHEFMWNPITINGIESLVPDIAQSDWKMLMETQHRGFRAPFLGRSNSLYEALGQSQWKIDSKWVPHRYTYDASGVSSELSAWPKKRAEGVWEFPLVTIPVPGRKRPVLSMDYNFYVAQSNGVDNPKKTQRFEEEMYQSYVNWFLRNYHGNRAPLNIGHHFSTWNKAAYWNALKRFTTEVCSKPEVRCVTYNEMVDVLENDLAGKIPKLAKGDFNQTARPQVSIPLVQLANAEVGTVFKANIKEDRYVLAEKGVLWKVSNSDIRQQVDLVMLAKQGQTHLIRINDGLETELMIDWNPVAGTASLKQMLPADIHVCDEKAHAEDVDSMLLRPSIEI